MADERLDHVIKYHLICAFLLGGKKKADAAPIFRRIRFCGAGKDNLAGNSKLAEANR